MSVDATSLPSPAFYSYPSSLPAGLTAGPATSSAAPSSASTSTSASSSSTASPLSAYEAEFDTLQTDDAEELMNVSLGSTANAQSNLASVLAQAAALQDAQRSAQQQQASTDADAAVQSSALGVPTLQSIVSQSDGDASTNLGNYQTSGSSIDLLA
ncbi:MAG TPA: hypothetical protein VHT05_02365 [Candidatus Elarobacter sp.]|jgi:hypothetical protein|nr:hypothetical protein [Candidatus Elarobacter sp.]